MKIPSVAVDIAGIIALAVAIIGVISTFSEMKSTGNANAREISELKAEQRTTINQYSVINGRLSRIEGALSQALGKPLPAIREE